MLCDWKYGAGKSSSRERVDPGRIFPENLREIGALCWLGGLIAQQQKNFSSYKLLDCSWK